MIFKLDKRGKADPATLPCGCPTIKNLKAVGLDGEPVQGLTGLNSVTGWMRIQRCAVYPGLLKTVNGRTVATEMGVQNIQVTAPFELRCVKHEKLEEP